MDERVVSIHVSARQRPLGWRGVLTVILSSQWQYSRTIPITRQTKAQALNDAELAKLEAYQTGQCP